MTCQIANGLLKNGMEILDLVAVESYAVSAAFRRHGEALARHVGQTQARWQVMRVASAGALSVPQIARRLGVTRQNVQRIADALMAEQLAHQVINRDHKTSPHIVLTAKGREVLDALMESTADYRTALLPLLEQIDVANLLATLRSLSEALAAADPLVEALVGPEKRRKAQPAPTETATLGQRQRRAQR